MLAVATHRRILVVDDNPSIHEDFRKILGPVRRNDVALAVMEQALFGEPLKVAPTQRSVFHVDVASQGEEGVQQAIQAMNLGNPYAVAFIDVRMPPGMDGIATAAQLLQLDPDIHVVICTAFSDYSWDEMRARLGATDRLLILKKPFDTVEVLQLAETLSTKWQSAQQTKRRFSALDQLIEARTRALESNNRQLDVLQQQLTAAAQRHQLAAVSTQVQRRLIRERELQQAIDNGQLSVHYQPLIDCATGQLVSLEALVRWQHPQQGWISPSEFIPVAEETGLILPLGEFVLRHVCDQVMSWQRERLAVVPVAVNISAIQLQQLDMASFVRRVLRDAGMDPRLLALEITESALVRDTQSHSRYLHSLRHDGVQIEIDDFGTGYSSLSYLRQLPVDTLKIDRSFISKIDCDPKDEVIVSAIIVMAHTLGIKVVAEGVETAAQLAALRGHGCEYVQGYFLSRPLPAVNCRDWLRDAAYCLEMTGLGAFDRLPQRAVAAVR